MTKRTCQTEHGARFPGLPGGRKGRDVHLIFWLLNYVVNQHLKKPVSHTFLPCGQILLVNYRQHSKSSVMLCSKCSCRVNWSPCSAHLSPGGARVEAGSARLVRWGWTGLRRPSLPKPSPAISFVFPVALSYFPVRKKKKPVLAPL